MSNFGIITPEPKSKTTNQTLHNIRLAKNGYRRRNIYIHKDRLLKIKDVSAFLGVPLVRLIDYLVQGNILTIENIELIRKSKKHEIQR